LLGHEVARGLRRRGARPRLLIYTFENQPWEQTLLLGFRRYLPQTVLVGCQHAPFAEHYLSASPSLAQWRDGSAPDLLVTLGADSHDRMIAMGAPPDRVLVGGAWRFPDLLALPPKPLTAIRQILVSCTVDFAESFELVHKAAAALEDLPGLTLMVNFHPSTNLNFRASIRDKVLATADAPHIRFVDGPAREWLEQADVLLYNSSGTAFEAAALGIPAIYVGPVAGLDLDKMPGNDAMRCRHPAALRELLRGFAADPGMARGHVDKGRERLRRCFANPDMDAWGEILAQVTGAESK
jgi:hypothetical protein